MNTRDILNLVRRHIGNGAAMDSSARSCLEDASVAEALGEYTYARQWALRSLSYSVGIFHEDYQAVAAVVGRLP